MSRTEIVAARPEMSRSSEGVLGRADPDIIPCDVGVDIQLSQEAEVYCGQWKGAGCGRKDFACRIDKWNLRIEIAVSRIRSFRPCQEQKVFE